MLFMRGLQQKRQGNSHRSSWPAKAIRTRWTVHARFGHRAATLRLLQEWLEGVATQSEARILAAQVVAAAIGAPDSELQLELDFEDLSALDRFWQTLPQSEHVAWLERLQNNISEVHGSPRWMVYHIVPCSLQAGQQGDRVKAETPPDEAADSSRAEELAHALTSQLSHPATLPRRSMNDLPVELLSMSGEVGEKLHFSSKDCNDADGIGYEERKDSQESIIKNRTDGVPLRVGGGIKIPAGGAPAGSRLGAMVGDVEFYRNTPSKT